MTREIWFWIGAIALFVVVEAVTVGLTSIWFALGSAAALMCAALGGPVWLQIVWFFVISLITLFLTRPLMRRYLSGHAVATNADRNIGATAPVTERIDNINGTGAVKLNGLEWTARSDDECICIPKGALVTVVAISGAKLIVRENH